MIEMDFPVRGWL